MKEHIYKGNKILQYGPTSFLATAVDEEMDPITSFKRNLEDAKKWIDKNAKDNGEV